VLNAGAELRLRGIAEPHDRVRSMIEALRRETDRHERFGQPDGLIRRIKGFLAELRGPKN
jgi:hypothetical protein